VHSTTIYWQIDSTGMSKTGVSINACPLVCYLPELRDNPSYYSQKKTLPQLKKTHPWYAGIYSQVLQDVVKRVKVTFDRFLKGDSNGKA
jgi:putative transposase